MTDGFTFEIDDSFLKAVESEVQSEVEAMQSALVFATGADLVGLIRNRVAKGMGSDDLPMTTKAEEKDGRYSASYGALRRSAKRQVKIRDLSMSGDTMRGITVSDPMIENGEAYVTIHFAGGVEILMKAVHNERMTPFFGVSPKDEDILNKAVEFYIDDFLTKREGKK